MTLINKIFCKLLGHNDTKYLVDGDGIHLKQCCIIRIRICNRCKRTELL